LPQLEGQSDKSQLKSPEVWATCVKYLANRTIDKRISNDPAKAQFLLVNFSRTSHFYEVSLDENSGAWRQKVLSKNLIPRESPVVFEFSQIESKVKLPKSPDIRPPRYKKTSGERPKLKIDSYRASIDLGPMSITPRTSIESMWRRDSPRMSIENTRPSTARASSLMSSCENLQRFPSAEEINSQKTIPLSSVTPILASNMSLFKSITTNCAKPPLTDLRKSMTDLKSDLSTMCKKLENAKALKLYLGEDSKENCLQSR